MELYVKIKLNGIDVERKVSLFGDEDIELTRAWGDKQNIIGYGSYSTSFSVPIDSNNQEIFKYYDIIGGSLQDPTNILDPSYLIPARIIVNELEILGYISINSFSIKKEQKYSYSLNFYGNEKDLVKDLNKSKYPKLNDVPLTDIVFEFTYENVIATWEGIEPICYVPLMANDRAFIYRIGTSADNNIATSNGTTGIKMKDLAVSYNFKKLMTQFFTKNDFTLSFSTEVEKFLTELYVMPNTKVEYGADLTSINTKCYANNLYENRHNILTFFRNNDDNVDVVSFNRTTNEYIANVSGKYSIKLSFKQIEPIYISDAIIDTGYVWLQDLSTNAPIKYIDGTQEKWYDLYSNKSIDIEVNLVAGQRFKILTYFQYFIDTYDYYGIFIMRETFQTYYTDNQMACDVSIQLIETDLNYNFRKTKINFIDSLISDFLINFCKSFNIFFIYNKKDIKLYFKYELPNTVYDLSNYFILDKDYTFKSKQKYKTIDYKFEEGKDINNIIYKKNNGTNLEYGEQKIVSNYDIGIDKLEFKSIFTVFPRTELNKTNNNNDIIESTGIPLHTELNESYSSLSTDFLLFYRLGKVTTLSYSIQNGTDPTQNFTNLTEAPDYGPDGPNGYSLDYNKLKMGIDNITKKYETTLEFILPSNILYKLKVYDYILVQGYWYEINEITSNIKTGYTKIKVTTK